MRLMSCRSRVWCLRRIGLLSAGLCVVGDVLRAGSDGELWRPVPGYAGYEVSTYGRVRFLQRTVIMSDGRKRHVEARILARHHSDSTPVYALWRDGERRCFSVRRLQAAAATSNRLEVLP